MSTDDLESLKTSDTSSWFDAWVDGLVKKHDSPVVQDPPWDSPSGRVDPWAAGRSDEPPF